MEVISTTVIALLVFSFLILIHELGHYLFARLFKVTIIEFSIGMGPKLLQKKSAKTGINYAISAIPIGGYVAMAGEDDETDDPNSFEKKPAWQRLIITLAGATVNVVAGVIAMLVLAIINPFGGTTVANFISTDKSGYEITTSEQGLMQNDTIIAVDGKQVNIADELSYEIMRRGNKPVELTVIRNGETVTLTGIQFPMQSEAGQTFGVMDFQVYRSEKNIGSTISYTFSKSVLIVRMCWESIYDLLTGRYTLAAVSGPVGISTTIGDAFKAGLSTFFYIIALISMNLGVMNLLPLPALDGGRTVMLLVEIVTRRRIPQRIEGMINAVGFALLMALSVIVMIKDVFQLIF